jgi:hypothetical protein
MDAGDDGRRVLKVWRVGDIESKHVQSVCLRLHCGLERKRAGCPEGRGIAVKLVRYEGSVALEDKSLRELMYGGSLRQKQGRGGERERDLRPRLQWDSGGEGDCDLVEEIPMTATLPDSLGDEACNHQRRLKSGSFACGDLLDTHFITSYRDFGRVLPLGTAPYMHIHTSTHAL